MLGLRACIVALGVVGCGGIYSVGSYDTGPVPDAGYQRRADKIDILFVVDNSLSMGTKQDLLRSAIPDFLDRLLVPECVSDDGKLTAPRVNGMSCPPGFVDKVKPVTDLHVGVITSSLGGGGGDQCDPTAHIKPEEAPTLTNFLRHNDDRGHLINRKKPDPSNPPPSGMEDPVPGALPASFLAWLPNGGSTLPPVPPYADRLRLYADFGDLVSGAQEFGCGLEGQLEAFYRFLIQPDPWDRIEIDATQNPPAASLVGVDPIVLQQRRDFLRPDSAVAVIVVTDEEDSWSDPMWLTGRGWITRSLKNSYDTVGLLPRGTAACAAPVDVNNPTMTGPNDPKCQWCPLAPTDANCTANQGLYSPNDDGLNVRYTNDMKRRYGMNPQFPIERYVDGLTSDMVPDRKGEHYLGDKLMSYYQGKKDCVNPLFAKSLPTDPNGELCNLVPGPRNASLVFFGIIGGVPWQLLTDDPRKGGKFKSSLDDDDWRRILGKDPSTYQDEGIDPHMLESILPRPGIACGIGATATCDPFHGREYDTKTTASKVDFQYACTFDLPQPKDCTKLPDGASCDCSMTYQGPLCAPNPSDNGNPTLQIRGKAYPTIRELRVAKGLGDHAVVGSICPRTVDVQDPDFGYRPALRALVDHMRVALF
jgi:hypothetical protein